MNLIPPDLNSYEFKSFCEIHFLWRVPLPLSPRIKRIKEFKEFNSEPDLNSYEFNSPRFKFI